MLLRLSVGDLERSPEHITAAGCNNSGLLPYATDRCTPVRTANSRIQQPCKCWLIRWGAADLRRADWLAARCVYAPEKQRCMVNSSVGLDCMRGNQPQTSLLKLQFGGACFVIMLRVLRAFRGASAASASDALPTRFERREGPHSNNRYEYEQSLVDCRGLLAAATLLQILR